MGRLWGAIAISLASLLANADSALADPSLPARTGAVVDAANILSPSQEQSLVAKAANLQSRSDAELVVVTLPSLQGYSIERWGRALGNGWKVGGSAARGVLLIVAPNDREVRIEIGDGLPMPDSAASSIIGHTILPKLRAGDMPGGILAGADAIAGAIRYPLQVEASGWRQFIPEINWGAVGLLAIAAIIFLLFVYQSLREATWPTRYDHATRTSSYIDQGDDDDLFFGESHSSSSSAGSWSSSGSSSDNSSSGGFTGSGASGRW